VELGTLGEILGLGSSNDVAIRLEEDARPSPGGEAALLCLPIEFRDALAALQDPGAIAETWAATEELVRSGYRAEGAEHLLRELNQFARAAQAGDGELVVWVSV
jgi:hypothetical protein